MTEKTKTASAPKAKTWGERACPGCGQAHASSLIPESELGAYEGQGVKASALPASASGQYRMFYCGGAFYAVVHQEGE